MNQYEYAQYLNRIRSFNELQEMYQQNFNLPAQKKENYLMTEDQFMHPESPFMGSKHDFISSEHELYNANEGFEKGNIFKKLYEPYKHHQPKNLKPQNDQEEIFLKICELEFAMLEIKLYLSVFPEDMQMIEKYNEFQKGYDQVLKMYEMKYMPLQCNNDQMKNSPFTWTEDVWPWDRRDF